MAVGWGGNFCYFRARFKNVFGPIQVSIGLHIS
jgi:hypothetical protein